jgi:hypothetical protein
LKNNQIQLGKIFSLFALSFRGIDGRVRPVVFTGQPICCPELSAEGETSMATKKKATNKQGKLRDLPKSKTKLTVDQERRVKGGIDGESSDAKLAKH